MSQIEKRAEELLVMYKATEGGTIEDYFGTAFLEIKHGLAPDDALAQTARGNNDYGIDGYHIDATAGNLYLYQFKRSPDWRQFHVSMQRLIKDGVAKIFSKTPLDIRENPLLGAVRRDISEFQRVIRAIYLRFVFTGDPKKAQDSDLLKDYEEQLGGKQYVMQEPFEQSVEFKGVEYLSTRVRSLPRQPPPIAKFDIDIGGDVRVEGPDGQQMHAGFVSIESLNRMFAVMGPRLFDRNIRAPLIRRDGTKTNSVNQKIGEALRRIVINNDDGRAFCFMHNGVTIHAQRIEGRNGQYVVIEPRVLNGAQTIAAVSQFIERNKSNPSWDQQLSRLAEVKVLCKLIGDADDDFVRSVTIATNRQNPVHPANLRANDRIQLLLADWFKEGTFLYERQENSAAWQDPEELNDQGINADRIIQMKRLGETFSVTDGKIERARNMNQLFDSDQQYAETFHDGRMSEDMRRIVLCYKSRTYCHNTIAKQLASRKAAFVDRAKTLLWALICQGILNNRELDYLTGQFGGDTRMPSDFRDYLMRIADRQVRPTLLWLVRQPEFARSFQEERYEFLRSDKAFARAMVQLSQQHSWRHVRLGRPITRSARDKKT